jgi:class 3 adenylate cyclase
MDKDELQQTLDNRAPADPLVERTPMAILFSDIKGSTEYAEKKGDVGYIAMIERHNRILFPIIEIEGGSVVKTIGDAILARFDDPAGAVKAAAGMQRALAEDRKQHEESEQIHIRIGVHYGFGVIKDNDVFGDVVNAASRVENQAEPGQILITDTLLGAAEAAGFECARMGRADLKGKQEQIEVYAVAWSQSATQQLIREVQSRHEKQIRHLKKLLDEVEQDFENARDSWREERRTLNTQITTLEEAVQQEKRRVREQLSEDLQSELKFENQELQRSRERLEQELMLAQQRFEAERNNLKAQIAELQGRIVESMEMSNNPARMVMALRDRVEIRVAEAKQEWDLQWQSERRRLLAEIERLKKTASPSMPDDKKEAARRAVLEKLGKLPAGSARAGSKTASEWERDFQDARIQWETEREQLDLKVRSLEAKLHRAEDALRTEISEEVRAEYDARLLKANRERQQLEQDIQYVTSELAGERLRLNARIKALEEAVPQAQEAARKKTIAELQTQFDSKLEETNRMRSRLERQLRDASQEWEEERSRARKRITELEEQLNQAREAALRAQKSAPPR